mmetsp:Transcript_27254/g.63768  ORF Transcript_27254/g.63768 Transcript_27254/m.63768 type:complete len:90 (-) Transcript_27254:67-336(-)
MSILPTNAQVIEPFDSDRPQNALSTFPNLSEALQPCSKLHSVLLVTIWYIAMSFSFFVLFKQDKVLLPLFGKRIPTHTTILEALLVRYI